MWALVIAAFGAPSGPDGLQTLELGNAAPDFELKGIDGKMHTLADYSAGKVLTIMFTCNHCPSAQAVEARFKKYVETYRPKGVEVVAISPNSPAGIRPDELGYSQYGDSYDDMVKHAEEQEFNFPYLYDGDTQSTAKAYGCLATPHVFIFDADRRLRYKGRFDDSRFVDESLIKTHDAIVATDALLNGEAVPVTITRPHGCSTKWAYKENLVKQHAAKLASTPVELASVDAAGLKHVLTSFPRFRMVNVWATWCAPCVQEFPDLAAVARKFGLRDFEFVSISLDQEKQTDKAKAFLAKQGVAPEPKLAAKLKAEKRTTTHFLFTGSSDELAAVLDPKMPGPIPHTILMNEKGEIVYRHNGIIDRHEVTGQILSHLGKYYAP
jgi:peroxiredoxin